MNSLLWDNGRLALCLAWLQTICKWALAFSPSPVLFGLHHQGWGIIYKSGVLFHVSVLNHVASIIKNDACTMLWFHIQFQLTPTSRKLDINGKLWASKTHVYMSYMHWDVRNVGNSMWAASLLSFFVDQLPGWTLHLPVVAVRQPRPGESVSVQTLWSWLQMNSWTPELISRHLLLPCVPHSQVSRELFTDLNCGRWGNGTIPPWLIYVFVTMIMLMLNSMQ